MADRRGRKPRKLSPSFWVWNLHESTELARDGGNATMAVLKLDGIRKSYRAGFWGRRLEVLKGLTLSLQEGEVFGFLGHNGAGKTTTIKLVLGFLKADAGRITIFGSVGATRRARARIGYLNEEVGLYPYLTASETLRFIGELLRLEKHTLRTRMRNLLEAVGLAEKAHIRVRNYSKGMRQRLGIAVALMNNPDLLLLDEPYTGLDPMGRKQLRDLLLALKREGKTILLSSHVAPDVEAVCDRVGILRDGKIARFLNIRDLYEAAGGEVDVVTSGVPAQALVSGVAGTKEIHSGKGFVVVRCTRGESLKALISSVYSFGGVVLEVRPAKATLEECLMETLGQGTDSAEAGKVVHKLSPEPSFTER